MTEKSVLSFITSAWRGATGGAKFFGSVEDELQARQGTLGRLRPREVHQVFEV